MDCDGRRRSVCMSPFTWNEASRINLSLPFACLLHQKRFGCTLKGKWMKIPVVVFLLALAATHARCTDQCRRAEARGQPAFHHGPVATFNLPWRIAFLPDGRMLITEKAAGMRVGHAAGRQDTGRECAAGSSKAKAAARRLSLAALRQGSQRLPHLFGAGRGRFEPGSGQSPAGAGPASASLEGLKVIWRDGERGKGGQFGAQVAFSPDGRYLFLTVGERQRMTPAQDPNHRWARSCASRWTASPRRAIRMAGKKGAASVPVIDPPSDTEAAKTAPVVRTYTFPGPNLTPSETWSSGHRTPYGLAFAPDGRCGRSSMGPRAATN